MKCNKHTKGNWQFEINKIQLLEEKVTLLERRAEPGTATASEEDLTQSHSPFSADKAGDNIDESVQRTRQGK